MRLSAEISAGYEETFRHIGGRLWTFGLKRKEIIDMIITDYYINQLTANERGVHMSIPKYQQIKQSLLYEINNGMFQPGDKFYSEAELKKKI